jgi:glucan biosynthesis protein C
MKATPQKTERIYSLDSLRAILMVLGIVLHSTLTYLVDKPGEFKDPMGGHIFNNYIKDFIHVFRMQHFYVIAGFFGAMLFYDRGTLQIIKNRFSRIVLPFVLFLLLLYPFVRLANSYTKLRFSGSNTAFASALDYFSSPSSLLPNFTWHMWFLYYLILFTAFSIFLGVVFKKIPSFSNQISKAFGWIMQQTKFRVLILNTMMHSDRLCFILGVVLFSVYFFMEDSMNELRHLKLIIESITTWLLIFGITGLFIRYGSTYSKRMRYISDSSYWVYLLHLPLTFAIPGLIADWPLHANLKLLVVVISTTIICFVTYHYLVRGTFVGQFLNGRKYSIKKADRL